MKMVKWWLIGNIAATGSERLLSGNVIAVAGSER
jgi:hypothetical protein